MLKAAYTAYNLNFKFPAKTSRATMLFKRTYLIKIWNSNVGDHIFGLGECALFEGLSADDTPNYETVLTEVCRDIDNLDMNRLDKFPSIRFGVETAMADLNNGACRQPFPSPWSHGLGSIPINGLVWMGSADEMTQRVKEKLNQGFSCIKLKIGGIDFNSELNIIRNLRSRFSPDYLQIRLDANGAFTSANALQRLDALSKFNIHSIEQPIKPSQEESMARICRSSPIPVALDEELIGKPLTSSYELLEFEKPSYIILKPSLCGGFFGAQRWIDAAKSLDIGWWVTSALESNIGLNAIAQWTFLKNVNIHQGLGTGQLYINNFESPLYQSGEILGYDINKHWKLPYLSWKTFD